ncbi:MAG: hypothetical protein HQL72_08770 [Magnetococcales bacterium]|nr:hypothetical protein [Magnetococcales bacterium]
METPDNPLTNPRWQQIESLIREVEALSCSTQWRQTAKSMRQLRLRFQAEGENPSPEQCRRFECAQQVFLDRQAVFFAQENRQKGERLIESIASIQQQLSQIQTSVRLCNQSLDAFNQQLETIQDQPHQEEIKTFIQESISTLKQDILQQTTKQQVLEEQVAQLSSRYCGP